MAVETEDPKKTTEGGKTEKIDWAKHEEVGPLLAQVREEERNLARTREQGLSSKKDQLLAEKKAFTDLIPDVDTLKTILAELEDLRTKVAAGSVGAKPEDFEKKVEEVAGQKAKIFIEEHKRILQGREAEIATQAKTIADLKASNHLQFVGQEFWKSAIPEDLRIVQDGAEDVLIAALAPFVEAREIEGLPRPVARIKVNGALVHGAAKDGYMDFRELTDLIRLDRSPLPVKLGYYLVSGARGSDTNQPAGAQPGASKPWNKMTSAERTNFISKHGGAAAQKLIQETFK